MDIRIRRTITAIFFLIFFIVSPLLLLYSSGYRYDFKRGSLLRTGNIFIETKDLREATISLDGEPYKELLTKKLFIKNLLPGEYTVKVEKEGWYGWEKTLRVEPTMTTFVKDLVLFEKNSPMLEIGKKVSAYEISPNRKLMAYIATDNETQEVYITSLEYALEELVYRNAQLEPLELSWAPSSNKLMIASSENVDIIKTASFPNTTVDQIDKNSEQFVRWDKNTDNLIYLGERKNIFRYDLVVGSVETVYQTVSGQTIRDFSVDGSKLLVIANDPINTLVLQANGSNVSVVAKLPRSEDNLIGQWLPKYLTVVNSALNRISLIQLRDDIGTSGLLNETVISLDGNEAFFSSDQQKLLIIDDYELNYLDLAARKVNLISRFGQHIDSASWYTDDLHVIINLNDRILISDMSIKAEKGLLETAQGQDLKQAKLLNEKYLFFTGTVGEETGLFKLRLR